MGMVACVAILAQTIDWQVPAPYLFVAIQLLGLACFAYIVTKRVAPLMQAQRDLRWDRPWLRIQKLLKFWSDNGSIRATASPARCTSLSLPASSSWPRGLSICFSSDCRRISLAPAAIGRLYDIVADYAATIVFLAVSGGRDSPRLLQAGALRRSGEVRQRSCGRRHLLTRR